MGGSLFTFYKNVGDFVKCVITILLQIQQENNFLPTWVNTDRPELVAFLVFVCTTASFIAQILSSENFSKWDAILTSVTKQWIAKDIPSYGSQSKQAKIAIHSFGKYSYKRN